DTHAAGGGAVPGRGRSDRPAAAPEHRPDLRDRRGQRTAVPRPGAGRGRHARRAAPTAPVPAAGGRGADRGAGPGGPPRPRAWRRPPRLEAGEHIVREWWSGEW